MTAHITVARDPDDMVGLLRSHRVVVDGATVGHIRRGQSLSAEVSPGRHELHLAMDWTRSPAVELDLADGEEVRVRCWATLSRTALFRAIFQRQRFLEVEVHKTGADPARTD